MIIVLGVIFTLIVIAFLCYFFKLVEICGDSMYPTYVDGEAILATRLFSVSNLKKGDVIMYYSPSDDERRVVIKRIYSIKKIEGEYFFYCLGDNSAISMDSRYYGYVPVSSILFKAVFNRENKAQYVV